MVKELTAEQVRHRCSPDLFDCSSTKDLTPMEDIIGQDRALSALKFGLNISKKGFNIFVSGLAGTGRTTAIKSYLDIMAAKKEPPADWCYVHSFKDPYCPNALKLPSGMGVELRKDMQHTVVSAQRNLAEALSSKEHTGRRAEISDAFNKKREAAFSTISKKAAKKGLLLQVTQAGFMLLPASKGKAMSEEEYQQLSAEDKEELRKRRDELTRNLKEQVARVKAAESTLQQELEEIDSQVADEAISPLFDKMREKYGAIPELTDYLTEVEKDIVENFEQFKPEQKNNNNTDPMAALQVMAKRQSFRKYEVNVLVDNSEIEGAPVILEMNPTFSNLFGRIEKESQLGALYTDFTLIKGGSLHQANGGFLVLRIEDAITNYQCWEGLKRTIREGKLVIEDISERLGFAATKSLKPEPIPLDVKVVIIGEPMFYYMLWRADPEFKELFKVKADFDSRMDKTKQNLKNYAAVICRVCREENLRHLKSEALAKIIEHSSRLAGDQSKLSALFADIADIIREANFWAKEGRSSLITAKHVEKAIEQRVYRSNLIQERINEMITEGTIMIDSKGEKVGQVNGLEVLNMGDFAFGKPARITASVSLGREGLIDIEREAKLGGRLHTKGVMILNGHMAEKYARDIPLSLSARLVFEQSYGEVDGDSASSTELYALLSRLAEAPLKQYIAVTGSVNQKGEVQAIGGINQKIEGYFEVCRAKGLTGKQGVLVPASNVKNLMLKESVVEAVAAGRFHIYPVSTIDEGIEVLTGMKAGKLRASGRFEPKSINDRVQKRLTALAERLREFGKGPENSENEKPKKK